MVLEWEVRCRREYCQSDCDTPNSSSPDRIAFDVEDSTRRGTRRRSGMRSRTRFAVHEAADRTACGVINTGSPARCRWKLTSDPAHGAALPCHREGCACRVIHLFFVHTLSC